MAVSAREQGARTAAIEVLPKMLSDAWPEEHHLDLATLGGPHSELTAFEVHVIGIERQRGPEP